MNDDFDDILSDNELDDIEAEFFDLSGEVELTPEERQIEARVLARMAVAEFANFISGNNTIH